MNPCVRTFSNLRNNFRKERTLSRAYKYRHVIPCILCCVLLPVCRKRAVHLKGRVELFRSGISLKIVGYIFWCEFGEVVKISEKVGLPTDDKSFWYFRNLHKRDVPKDGIASHLIPSINSRNGHIEDHRTPSDMRIPSNERIRHHSAYVVTNDVNTLEFKRQRKLIHVPRHRRCIVAVWRYR